jgi:hypothetical protein
MKSVLTPGVLAIVASLAAAAPLRAQEWTCYMIQRGDTAARVATRISGSAEARHQAWFQIVDPTTRGFVPKDQYDYILPGWRACLLRPSLAIAAGDAPRPTARALLSPLWVVAPLGLVMLLAYAADRYLHDRQAVTVVLTQFGEAFVREFERPLIETRAPAQAVRSRLRVRPHHGEVEVRLAPAGARRYPNLTDHRSNVIYDTERVLRMLRNPPFVGGQPRQRGDWVVIPFRFKQREKQEGAS